MSYKLSIFRTTLTDKSKLSKEYLQYYKYESIKQVYDLFYNELLNGCKTDNKFCKHINQLVKNKQLLFFFASTNRVTPEYEYVISDTLNDYYYFPLVKINTKPEFYLKDLVNIENGLPPESPDFKDNFKNLPALEIAKDVYIAKLRKIIFLSFDQIKTEEFIKLIVDYYYELFNYIYGRLNDEKKQIILKYILTVAISQFLFFEKPAKSLLYAYKFTMNDEVQKYLKENSIDKLKEMKDIFQMLSKLNIYNETPNKLVLLAITKLKIRTYYTLFIDDFRRVFNFMMHNYYNLPNYTYLKVGHNILEKIEAYVEKHDQN